MNTQVYVVCGVSGSGKTWVCKQLADKFCYVPHDEHYSDHVTVMRRKSLSQDKPMITECPFGERLFCGELQQKGLRVTPVFVIEHPDLIASRYHSREKKPISKAAYTRAHTISKRAKEWNAFAGTSQEVLEHLKGKA